MKIKLFQKNIYNTVLFYAILGVFSLTCFFFVFPQEKPVSEQNFIEKSTQPLQNAAQKAREIVGIDSQKKVGWIAYLTSYVTGFFSTLWSYKYYIATALVSAVSLYFIKKNWSSIKSNYYNYCNNQGIASLHSSS